jgi:TonB-dependent receptor
MRTEILCTPLEICTVPFASKILRATVTVVLALGICAGTSAEENGTIDGRVTVGRAAQPLGGATVEIRETGSKTATGPDGSYSLPAVAPGTYTLVVTPPGGQATESKVSVVAGKTSQRNIGLETASAALESIVVTAQRTTLAVAREAQMEAPNVINIQTYEEIRKLPDVTTAEAVRRVPGISLETDEGEGRYVNIRGLDADLNSTTFGGLRLPPTNNASPFGGYRAVTLDSIPIGLVGAITVTKSNLPSQDAEALGGTIEITPKTAPQSGAPFLEGHAGSGFEPLRATGIIDVALTAGGRFGGGTGPYSARPFSIVATATYYDDQRGIDDVEPGYINDSAHPYQAINNIQQRDYELHRKRHGYGIDLGYQLDADNSYYVRAFDAGYTEKYRRQILALSPDGNTIVLANGMLQDTLAGSSAIQKTLRDEQETSRDRVFMAGGKSLVGTATVDYRVGYTKGSWDKPYDFNSTFTLTPAAANSTITYNNGGPGNTPAYTIAGANYLNPAAYQLTGFANSSAYNFDKELSFAANASQPVAWAGFDAESVKIGASVRLRHKQTNSQPYSGFTLPALSLATASSGGGETYYAGHYQNGVDIAPGYLQALLGPGTIIAPDQTSNQQQYLDAKENVYAAYGQYQMDLGRIGIVGGARIEQTRDDSNAFSAGVNAINKPFVNPVNAANSYTNLFPSLQGRLEISPRLIARATYSSTIARPGFNQSNVALSIDLGAGVITKGNPGLKPATANNFDFTLEKYLDGGGIVSVGAFDKEIDHYIVPMVLANQLYPGNALPVKVFSYDNAGHSYVRGLELNWEQRFRQLPGLWSGLGAGVNYTFVDSSYQIRPGENSQLPSTSRNTWNASLLYERDGLSLRLAAYSVSADLFGIGSDKTSDVFNAKRTSMDFGSSYALLKNWAVYFNAKNLLNTPHAFYQGTPDRPIQREFYGQTYQAGVRFDY